MEISGDYDNAKRTTATTKSSARAVISTRLRPPEVGVR
jgi:hypothetical protein